MKTKIILLMMFMTLISQSISQTIQHPWWVVDRGGGKSTTTSHKIYSSVGQPAIQKMVHLDTGRVLESGYIPGINVPSGSYSAHQFNFADGWNLISIPFILSDYRTNSLFPTAASSAFAYEGSYIFKDTLSNGCGYWFKFSGAEEVSILGRSYTLDTIDVQSSWNMIGTNSYPVAVSAITPIPPLTIESAFFKYDGDTYVEENTLQPGFGYWIRVSTDGKLVLKSNLLSATQSPISIAKSNDFSTEISTPARIAKENGFYNLNITDATGKSVALYFSSDEKQINLRKCEMPPPSPSDKLDVRFSSQRIIEMLDSKKEGEPQKFPIRIYGGRNPITISWSMPHQIDSYELELVTKEGKLKSYPIVGVGKVNINTDNGISVRLVMFGEKVKELPQEFALHQNYPNPFNPSTMIKYDLPDEAQVSIRIFNMLGQEVEKVVDEIQDEGFKSVEWNASKFPSGTYFYRLSVNEYKTGKSFQILKKMLLIR